MKNAQAEQAADVGLGNNNGEKASTLSTANLLSRVEYSGCGDRDEGLRLGYTLDTIFLDKST